MLVVPATREAEAGESLEPGSGAYSKPRSSHCTPAWVTRVKLQLKQTNKTFSKIGMSRNFLSMITDYR